MYNMNLIFYLVLLVEIVDKLFLILKINKMYLYLYKNLKLMYVL